LYARSHNYYNSSQADLQRLRIENYCTLSGVVNMLEQVVLMMDQEELKRGMI
jgi:hypothetical protein